MRSLDFLYPRQSVVDNLKKLLKLKDYSVLSFDENEGIIHAVKKRTLKQDLTLDLKISAIDSFVTKLILSVSVKNANNNKQFKAIENEEQHFFLSVERFFN